MPKGIIDSTVVVLFLLLFLAPVRVNSDIYSWVDANGVRHFSNTQTNGSGNEPNSAPEFIESREENERVEGGASEKSSKQLRERKDEEETQSRQKAKRDRQAHKEQTQLKAREELQAQCNDAKERLSTLRFTSLDKYENPDVEKYAVEWRRHHLASRYPKQGSNWKKERDEDIQKYKKLKYEKELNQAEKNVDDHCKN